MTAPALPEPLARAVGPVFEALPLDQAMAQLVVQHGASDKLQQLVETAVQDEALGPQSPLAAGLWLYIDELDRSHRVSQGIDDATGSYWHGIMHRREGDFSNSHHWFRRVGEHPAIVHIKPTAGTCEGDPAHGGHYDPHLFIDRVEEAQRTGDTSLPLIELQRREWVALFRWCAGQS